MGNLDLQNLRARPAISQDAFRKFAGKILTGKERVTSSVEKHLRDAGLYHGKSSLGRSDFSKKMVALTKYIKEKGIKTSYFGKKVIASVKTEGQGRLAAGGIAQKSFQQNVKQQMTTGEPVVDRKTLNRLKGILMQGRRLTEKEKSSVPKEVLEKLENKVRALQNFYRQERAKEIEKEAKMGVDQSQKTGLPQEKAQSSAIKTPENQENKPDQKSTTPSGSGASFVPLQGGLGGIERQENVPPNVAVNLPPATELPDTAQESPSENTPPTSPPQEKDTSSDIPTEPPEDMEIG